MISDDNAIDLGGSGVAMKCADVSLFASEVEEDAEIEYDVHSPLIILMFKLKSQKKKFRFDNVI